MWLTFAMREGKNREIRNVLGHLGLAVNRLIRVSYGPFQLGDLPDGSVEEVKTRALREQIGERIAALTGADFSGPLVEREAPIRKATPRPPETRAAEPGRRPAREQAPRAAKPLHRRGAPDRSSGKKGRPPKSFESRSFESRNFDPRKSGSKNFTSKRPPRADGERKPSRGDDRPPPRRGGGRPYKGRRDR